MTLLKKAALSVLLFLVFFLPFVNKPFHIDDGNFISMSKAIGFNPLHIKKIGIYFMGNYDKDFSPLSSTHPVFIPYFIKLIGSIFGIREIPLHIAFFIFTLIAFWSFYAFISSIESSAELRVDWRFPVFVSLLLVSNPAYLANAHDIMTDVPLLAFWLLTIVLFIKGVDYDNKIYLLLSSVFLVFSILIAYQSLFLIPILASYLIINRKPGLCNIASLTGPFIIFAAFILFVSIFYNISALSSAISESMRWFRIEKIYGRALSVSVNTGFALLFLIIAYVVALPKRIYVFEGIISLIAAVLLSLQVDYSLSQWLYLIALSTVGIFCIAEFIRITLKEAGEGNNQKRLNLFLLSWITIVMSYNILFMPFGSTRYLLPAIPPLLYIFSKRLWYGVSVPSRQARFISGKTLALIALGLTMMLGLMTAYADYQFASSYRDMSKEVKAITDKTGEKVWYMGDWGMHYYMDKQGFHYLTADSNEPRVGDVLIIAKTASVWNMSFDMLQRVRLIGVREYDSWFPGRVHSELANAGYYSSSWGYLPFTFSKVPVEVFGIFRVVRD